MQGANDRDVINALGHVRKEFADLNAALAVLPELERGRKGGAGFAFRPQILHGQRFAGIFLQSRLGIERIHVRRPAVHKKVDDPLGFGGERRRFGRQRRKVTAAGLRHGHPEAVEQAGQA